MRNDFVQKEAFINELLYRHNPEIRSVKKIF